MWVDKKNIFLDFNFFFLKKGREQRGRGRWRASESCFFSTVDTELIDKNSHVDESAQQLVLFKCPLYF